MKRTIPNRAELLAFKGTRRELAAHYGVSLRTMYRWLRPRVYNERGGTPKYSIRPHHYVCVIRLDGTLED